MKRTAWVIYSLEMISSKVIFKEALTEEEAKARYKSGDYEDILDQEFRGCYSIDSAEPCDTK
jgi:hypothetical protein